MNRLADLWKAKNHKQIIFQRLFCKWLPRNETKIFFQIWKTVGNSFPKFPNIEEIKNPLEFETMETEPNSYQHENRPCVSLLSAFCCITNYNNNKIILFFDHLVCNNY